MKFTYRLLTSQWIKKLYLHGFKNNIHVIITKCYILIYITLCYNNVTYFRSLYFHFFDRIGFSSNKKNTIIKCITDIATSKIKLTYFNRVLTYEYKHF